MWLKIDFMYPENSRRMKNPFPVQCLKSDDSSSRSLTVGEKILALLSLLWKLKNAKINHEKILNFQ